MGNKTEQFNLEPGDYSFRHHMLGRVNLEVRDSSIYVHGEREEKDSLGESSFIQTVRQGVDAVTIRDAFNALPRGLQGILVNFQMEREVVSEGAEIVVFDSRASLSIEERRSMARSGRVPARCRLFKADSF